MTQLKMRQQGMTLLEVLVALFIFAFAGTAVMKAAGEHLNAVGQIEEMTFATWVANNQLTRVMLGNQWPPKNNQKGKEQMAQRTWYWQLQVKATKDKDLRAVEVIVGLDPQYQGSITSVMGYVSKPTKKN